MECLEERKPWRTTTWVFGGGFYILNNSLFELFWSMEIYMYLVSNKERRTGEKNKGVEEVEFWCLKEIK